MVKHTESSGNDETLNNTQALQEITDYYLSGKQLLSLPREAIQQILLALISISGASLYAMPAYEYAINHGSILAGSPLLMRKINYTVSTCLPALVVLYNATDIFLVARRSEEIPNELRDYLEARLKKKEKIAQDIGIVVGSAISAMPLMLVSFAYPLPMIHALWQKILIGAVIEIDNTVLHFLPIKLALSYPIYRIPALPFEWMVKKFCARQVEMNVVAVDNDAEALREKLIHYVAHCRTSLLLDKNQRKLFSYHWALGQNFKQKIKEIHATDLMPHLLEEFPIDNMNMNVPRTPTAQQWLRHFVGLLGALLVLCSCSGYLLSSISQVLNWTEIPVLTGLIVAPSIYFLSVLLTFFGYFAATQLHDFMTHWGKNDPKLPLEFKLYPKMTTALNVINLYVALYSYAGAEELVINTFDHGILVDMQPAFIWFARTGISFLGLSAMKDFYHTILLKFAMHFGGEDSRIVARLMVSLDQLEQALHRAKPEVFAKDNLQPPFSDLFSDMVPMSPNDMPRENTPLLTKQKQGWRDWAISKCCFFRSTTNDVEETGLSSQYQSGMGVTLN